MTAKLAIFYDYRLCWNWDERVLSLIFCNSKKTVLFIVNLNGFFVKPMKQIDEMSTLSKKQGMRRTHSYEIKKIDSEYLEPKITLKLRQFQGEAVIVLFTRRIWRKIAVTSYIIDPNDVMDEQIRPQRVL